MEQPTSYKQVIGLWPSITDLATELGEKPFTVEKWRTRNRVPDRVWKRLVLAAETRNLPVTTDLLAELAEKRPS